MPLLALISLVFVPGPVFLAAFGLARLMAWRRRPGISCTGMSLLPGGLRLTPGVVAGHPVASISRHTAMVASREAVLAIPTISAILLIICNVQ